MLRSINPCSCWQATNRPQELDEAMHRRITMSFEFRKPDHVQVSRQMRVASACMCAPWTGLVSICPDVTRVLGMHPQRQQIWRRQLPAKVKLEEDVDITALALKFELSGGYIRNALQAALIRCVPAVPCDASAATVQHSLISISTR